MSKDDKPTEGMVVAAEVILTFLCALGFLIYFIVRGLIK